MIVLTVFGLVILALLLARRRNEGGDMAVKGPGWRPLTWVIILFNVLMVAWLVSGVATVADNCAGEVGSSLEACEAGTAIGAGIGAAFIIFVWAAGDVVLGVVWLVTRKTAAPGRACPVCGAAVAVGLVVCGSCGHDYRTGTQGPVPERPAIWPPPNVTERRR